MALPEDAPLPERAVDRAAWALLVTDLVEEPDDLDVADLLASKREMARAIFETPSTPEYMTRVLTLGRTTLLGRVAFVA